MGHRRLLARIAVIDQLLFQRRFVRARPAAVALIFAPLRTFAITKGLVFEYDVYLKIGTVDEIRSRFAQIRMNGEDVDDDPNFPKGYFYIKDSNNLTVEEEASSPTTGYTYKLDATGADASFTTQRSPTAYRTRCSRSNTKAARQFRWQSSWTI